MISARTSAALAVKKTRGERVGTVPYGWKVSTNGATIGQDAEEQAVLSRLRAWRAEGLSFPALRLGSRTRAYHLAGAAGISRLSTRC